MPQRLKTYVTTSGFFELAVAAPSMKAALEIWGAAPDLFRRGYAKETSEPDIVKATMAKPGVVLQRGVGSRGPFTLHAALPDISVFDKAAKGKSSVKPPAARKTKVAKPAPPDPTQQQEAARLYALAQKQREREKLRAEAAEKKARERRDREIKKAETALGAARDLHNRRMQVIERKLAEAERAAHEEDERWRQEKSRLEAALEKAREEPPPDR